MSIISCICCTAALAVCLQAVGLIEKQQNRKELLPNLFVQPYSLELEWHSQELRKVRLPHPSYLGLCLGLRGGVHPVNLVQDGVELGANIVDHLQG